MRIFKKIQPLPPPPKTMDSGRKRRKLAMSDVSDDELKKMSRKELRALRNRESAYKSRMKKRLELETLRQRVRQLEHENSILRRALGGGGGSDDGLAKIPLKKQTSADLFAATLGFSKKRSRNEYEGVVTNSFETLQQSRNRILKLLSVF